MFRRIKYHINANIQEQTSYPKMSNKWITWIYIERQKKLITSSGRRSLKSTLSKLVILGHKSALILLNKIIWKSQDFLLSNIRKMRLNPERSFFKKSQKLLIERALSELRGGSLFRTFNSYSFNFNGGLRKRRTGFCLLRTPRPRGKQFLRFLKIDLYFIEFISSLIEVNFFFF